jgi:hypothetical protein
MTIYGVHVLPHDRVESLSLCHPLAILMQLMVPTECYLVFRHSDPTTRWLEALTIFLSAASLR